MPTTDPLSHTRQARLSGKRIEFLVTADEHAAIVANAHAAGTSVATWVRRRALLKEEP